MKDQSRNKQNRDWGWEDGETFKIHTDKPLADQAKRKKKKKPKKTNTRLIKNEQLYTNQVDNLKENKFEGPYTINTERSKETENLNKPLMSKETKQ